MLFRQSRQYYVVHVRQGFTAHGDEDDPERIDEIVKKAYQDADWIVQKVGLMLNDWTYSSTGCPVR